MFHPASPECDLKLSQRINPGTAWRGDRNGNAADLRFAGEFALHFGRDSNVSQR